MDYKFMKRLVIGILVTLAGVCYAQTVPYRKFTLHNGMTFILHEDHSAPIVTVNTWFHVGSKDEPDKRSGFAHLFEHLMFMGTFRAPASTFDQLMEAGGGSNNASTTSDRTNFYDTGPSSQLPTLLWLEADRLEALGSAMTQKKLDLQREVVLNERRESENAPYGNADIQLNELLYPQGHPYHYNTIGLPEDLNAATVKDVKDFFATYYVPNNATMVIAGDFETAKIKPLIDSLFGTLPRKDDPVHRSAPQPHLNGVVRRTLVDKVEFPRITMAWHSPAIFEPGDAEMDLVSGILTSGISSRLYQKLIYEDKLATDVSSYQDSEKLGSEFVLNITVKDAANLAQVEQETDEVLASLLKEGPNPTELRRLLAQVEFSKLSRLQSLEDLADQLNEYDYFFGEPDSFRRDLDRYRNATTESVRNTAAKVLDPNSRVILTVLPKQAKPTQNPRNIPPKDFMFKGWTPEEPAEMTLSNGLRVLYWRRTELPLISILTLLQRGSELDPAGKEGAMDLVSEMLDQGAGGKSATDFSDALDLLGAEFSANVGQEATQVAMSCTESSFVPALALYSDALMRPNFDEQEWSRIKRQHQESLVASLDDPGTVAQRVASTALFGSNNPYGRPVSGTLSTVGKIGLEDIKAVYAQAFGPQDAVIFVAGSIDKEKLQASLEAALGKWKSDIAAPPKPKYKALSPKPLRVLLVDRPGAVQTVVRFVMPAPNGSSPNRVKLKEIGTIFGGTFTSRLMQNLRESKGYTYGAYATYVMQPSAGYVLAAADVRTNVTGSSLREFLKEFASIRTGNISAAEVKKASNSMRTDLVQSASTLESLLGTASSMYLQGRPYSQLGKDLQAIASNSAAQLNALVKGALPLENAVLVLVGDKAQILKQWPGLGLPQPTVVKAE